MPVYVHLDVTWKTPRQGLNSYHEQHYLLISSYLCAGDHSSSKACYWFQMFTQDCYALTQCAEGSPTGGSVVLLFLIIFFISPHIIGLSFSGLSLEGKEHSLLQSLCWIAFNVITWLHA